MAETCRPISCMGSSKSSSSSSCCSSVRGMGCDVYSDSFPASQRTHLHYKDKRFSANYGNDSCFGSVIHNETRKCTLSEKYVSIYLSI
jgi:hypothetical protein